MQLVLKQDESLLNSQKIADSYVWLCPKAVFQCSRYVFIYISYLRKTKIIIYALWVSSTINFTKFSALHHFTKGTGCEKATAGNVIRMQQ